MPQTMDFLNFPRGDLNTSRCSSLGILKSEDMECSEMNETCESEITSSSSVPHYLLMPTPREYDAKDQFEFANLSQASEIGDEVFLQDGVSRLMDSKKSLNPTMDTAEWIKANLGDDPRLSHIFNGSSLGSQNYVARSTSIGSSGESGSSSKTGITAIQRPSMTSFHNLTFNKDLFKAESFVCSDSDKAKLLDEDEKKNQVEFSIGHQDYSFVDASTPLFDTTTQLSKSSYFLMSTSRLGCLGEEDSERPPSDEHRPDLGFGKIVSPKNKPISCVKSPHENSVLDDESRRSLHDMKDKIRHSSSGKKDEFFRSRESIAKKNLQSKMNSIQDPKSRPSIESSSKSQKKTEDNHSQENNDLVKALKQGRENPAALAKMLYSSQNGGTVLVDQLLNHLGLNNNNNSKSRGVNETGLHQGTQLLPSFLEASTAFEGEQAKDTQLGPKMTRSKSPLPNQRSLIPKLSPKNSEKVHEKVVRHSSPMKKAKVCQPNGDVAVSRPAQNHLTELPFQTNTQILKWIACDINQGHSQTFQVHNPLSEETIPLRLSVQDSNQFTFAVNKTSILEVHLQPKEYKTIEICYTPKVVGFTMGKLALKPAKKDKTRGAGVKGVIKLWGQCGRPNLSLLRFSKPVNLDDISSNFLMVVDVNSDLGEFEFRNEGTVPGFVKLLLFDDKSCKHPSTAIKVQPNEIVLGPGKTKSVSFIWEDESGNSSHDEFIKLYLAIYRGNEVCRQIFKIMKGTLALGVDYSSQLEGEDEFEAELKPVHMIKWIKGDNREFLHQTSRNLIELDCRLLMKSPASFAFLPVEETLNQSQLMDVTVPQVVVKPPETIMEEESDTNERSSGSSMTKLPPLIKFEPDIVFFPPTALGTVSIGKLKLRNDSNETLQMEIMSLSPPFRLGLKQFEIKPHFFTGLKIHYSPTIGFRHEGVLAIKEMKSGFVYRASLKGSTTKLAIPKKVLT